MDRRGASLLTDGVLAAALPAEDVALLERADAIRLLIERENPTCEERIDLLAWVVWPTEAFPRPGILDVDLRVEPDDSPRGSAAACAGPRK